MVDPKLSLIICTCNRAEMLRQSLRVLNTQEVADVSGEVVLVDNGSTDETAAVMHTFKEHAACPVTLVEEETPGLGRARNAGLAQASGDVVVFTDDDCCLETGYLHAVNTVFESEEFAYCGGPIRPYSPSDEGFGYNQKDTFELIPPSSFLPAGKIGGANLIAHRKVIKKIKGFDPTIGAGTPFGFEDVDFCARASIAGFAGAYVPELVVYHRHTYSSESDIARHKKEYDLGRGAYYAKLALMGEFQFLKFWLPEIWERHRRNLKNPRASLGMASWTAREVCGALSYLAVQAVHAAVGIGKSR